MNHVQLHSYPFPPGMVIPRLMPFQEYPWNNDPHIAAEVLRLKEAHGLRTAFETGTCLGSTTYWLVENFDRVLSAEINEDFASIAGGRLGHLKNVMLFVRPSVDILDMRTTFETGPRFYFLDAHWGDHCPLLDELYAIAEVKVKPCILIHDFQVPGTDFGFDSMPDGRPFNLELIAPHLNRIYGIGGYIVNYPTKVAGAKRGWLSVEPCL